MDEFVYLGAVFFQIQGGEAAEGQVRDAVVVHVGVWVVRTIMVI